MTKEMHAKEALSDAPEMLADCESMSSKLSDWEVDFIDSISVQLGRGSGLSPKQEETLEKIWDRVTG